MKKLPPILTGNELAAVGHKYRARRERDVTTDQRGIVFRCAANYTVEWSRVRSKADAISWIYHLAEKDWFTQSRLCRFLDLLAEKKKWDLHCAP